MNFQDIQTWLTPRIEELGLNDGQMRRLSLEVQNLFEEAEADAVEFEATLEAIDKKPRPHAMDEAAQAQWGFEVRELVSAVLKKRRDR